MGEERYWNWCSLSRNRILKMEKVEQEAETLKTGLGLLPMASPWGMESMVFRRGGPSRFTDGLAGREDNA